MEMSTTLYGSISGAWWLVGLGDGGDDTVPEAGLEPCEAYISCYRLWLSCAMFLLLFFFDFINTATGLATAPQQAF